MLSGLCVILGRRQCSFVTKDGSPVSGWKYALAGRSAKWSGFEVSSAFVFSDRRPDPFPVGASVFPVVSRKSGKIYDLEISEASAPVPSGLADLPGEVVE